MFFCHLQVISIDRKKQQICLRVKLHMCFVCVLIVKDHIYHHFHGIFLFICQQKTNSFKDYLHLHHNTFKISWLGSLLFCSELGKICHFFQTFSHPEGHTTSFFKMQYQHLWQQSFLLPFKFFPPRFSRRILFFFKLKKSTHTHTFLNKVEW